MLTMNELYGTYKKYMSLPDINVADGRYIPPRSLKIKNKRRNRNARKGRK